MTNTHRLSTWIYTFRKLPMACDRIRNTNIIDERKQNSCCCCFFLFVFVLFVFVFLFLFFCICFVCLFAWNQQESKQNSFAHAQKGIWINVSGFLIRSRKKWYYPQQSTQVIRNKFKKWQKNYGQERTKHDGKLTPNFVLLDALEKKVNWQSHLFWKFNFSVKQQFPVFVLTIINCKWQD